MKNKDNDYSGNTILPNDEQHILRPIPSDIISLEDLNWLGPEVEVANFTVDIGKFFTSESEQHKKFSALEQLIHRKIDSFQADRGIGSVVLIGDKEKIRKVLDPTKLYLFDKTTEIFKLEPMPVDPHALVGEIARLLRRTDSWILPLRTQWLTDDWKNIIRLSFDIINEKDSDNNFRQAIHELMHHAEFEAVLHKTDDNKYLAYKERNTAFWDAAILDVENIRRLEKILMDDDSEHDIITTFKNLLDSFVTMKKWEAGEAPKNFVDNIRKEKYQTWLPNYAELYALMGIRIRSKDILEHYASGACGERLQKAAIIIAGKLSFDDQENKARQVALRFTQLHHMGAIAAKEHMSMIELRLSEQRKAFDKMFKEQYLSLEKTSSDDANVVD